MAIHRLSGKVLVRESRQPLENVLVVFYDIDRQSENGQEFLRTLVSGERLVPSGTEEAFWQDFPGQRIGSILTGSRGQFFIEFDDARFVEGEGRRPPDLYLFLFAPEVTHATTRRSNSLASRLIHYSTDLRVNAGLVEQTVILVPQDLVTRMDLQPGDTPVQSGLESSSFQLFRDAMSTHQNAVARVGFNLWRETSRAFGRFQLLEPPSSSVPFVVPGTSLVEVVNPLIDRAMNEWGSLLPSGKRVAFSLTREQVLDLGLSIDDRIGRVSGTLTLSEVLRLLRTRSQVSAGDRSAVLRRYCERRRAETEFDRISRECAPNVGEVEESPPPEVPVDEEDEEWDGRRELSALMESIGSPNVIRSVKIEKPDGTLSAIIQDGPTDVAAYHNFERVELAFYDTWSAAIDETLTPYLKSVYRQMVQFKNKVSGVSEFPPIVNRRDMRNFYEDFQDFLDSVDTTFEQEERSVDIPIPIPPEVRAIVTSLRLEEWNFADTASKSRLIALGNEYRDLNNFDAGDAAAAFFSMGVSAGVNELRKSEVQAEAQSIWRNIRAEYQETLAREGRTATERPSTPRRRGSLATRQLRDLVTGLDMRLSEPYQVDVFAKHSSNLGIHLVRQQRWVPESYQVGDLVSTIPLAPGEKRKYTKKVITKKSRSEKVTEEQEEKSSSESSSTLRADEEIVKDARNKISFQQTTNARISAGVFEGEFGTRFGVDAEKSSKATSKNFNEWVQKSAQEFRKATKTEVTMDGGTEAENTSDGEISNPNDGNTVTYLFYELQRRYLVTDKLHQVKPIILVARDVPNVSDINATFVIKHDWKLRRLIKDVTFLPAIDDIVSGMASRELSLEVLYRNFANQLRLVEHLTEEAEVKTKLAEEAFRDLRRVMTMADTAEKAQQMRDFGYALAFGPLGLLGSQGSDDTAEKREEIAKMAIDRADKEKSEISARLSRELQALNEAMEKYTNVLRIHSEAQVGAARLFIHLKDNIIDYMQGIWAFESPDQRYFELYQIEIPWIEEVGGEEPVPVSGSPAAEEDLLIRLASEDEELFEISATLPLTGDASGTARYRRTTRKLHEVADLDRPIGYKGNYVMLEAKETSYIHEFMMRDYLDPLTDGVRDPAKPDALYDAESVAEFLCCLRKHDPERFLANETELRRHASRALRANKEDEVRIIVPTESLFIEALQGRHAVMEDFNLVHRAIDVEKAKAELVGQNLENLRAGRRLSTGDFTDTADKFIRIEGDPDGIHVDSE